MSKPLHIAIAGLGTVGGGTLKILQDNAALLEARCGHALKVTAVSARDAKKKRAGKTDKLHWATDPMDLLSDASVDLVVEAIGGSEGVAKSLVEAALSAGKHVVTANKALIAHHGMHLAKLAEANNAMFAYEAAVAGGIPIIKTMREGLAANRFSHVAGVLNGTCNFILTSMWDKKREFDWALKQAQSGGYAEADPSFDIDGIDTAHKTAILTSLAYGCPLNIKGVSVEGISKVTILDMEFADQLGYVIKLLGITSRTDKGILQRVHPCLVPKLSATGRLTGAYNGIIVEGHAVGRITLEGLGAGEGPTASSIVGDIVDIARGTTYKPFTIPVADMKPLPVASMNDLRTSYYVRLAVVDKPGVLAAVTGIFRDEGISLREFQQSHPAGKPVQVVLVTHETQELAMMSALDAVRALDCVVEPPHMIRIEAL